MPLELDGEPPISFFSPPRYKSFREPSGKIPVNQINTYIQQAFTFNIKHASEPWEYKQFIFSSLNRVRDVIKKKHQHGSHFPNLTSRILIFFLNFLNFSFIIFIFTSTSCEEFSKRNSFLMKNVRLHSLTPTAQTFNSSTVDEVGAHVRLSDSVRTDRGLTVVHQLSPIPNVNSRNALLVQRDD